MNTKVCPDCLGFGGESKCDGTIWEPCATCAPIQVSDYDQDKMLYLLLALLDRIEIEQDWELSLQRFDIAEAVGLTVEYGEQVSGKIN